MQDFTAGFSDYPNIENINSNQSPRYMHRRTHVIVKSGVLKELIEKYVNYQRTCEYAEMDVKIKHLDHKEARVIKVNALNFDAHQRNYIASEAVKHVAQNLWKTIESTVEVGDQVILKAQIKDKYIEQHRNIGYIRTR